MHSVSRHATHRVKHVLVRRTSDLRRAFDTVDLKKDGVIDQ